MAVAFGINLIPKLMSMNNLSSLVVCETPDLTAKALANGLDNCGWMKHIKAVLDTSVFIAKVLFCTFLFPRRFLYLGDWLHLLPCGSCPSYWKMCLISGCCRGEGQCCCSLQWWMGQDCPDLFFSKYHFGSLLQDNAWISGTCFTLNP